MWQVNIQIGAMPFGLSLRSDGSVVVWRLAPLGELVDLDSNGDAWAFFWQDTFIIADGIDLEELSYNVAYPLHLYPALKKWLKHQNLQYPEFKESV